MITDYIKTTLSKIEEINEKYSQDIDNLEKRRNHDLSEIINEILIKELNKLFSGKYIKVKIDKWGYTYYLLCDCIQLINLEFTLEKFFEENEVVIKALRGFYLKEDDDRFNTYKVGKRDIELDIKNTPIIEIITESEYYEKIHSLLEIIAN